MLVNRTTGVVLASRVLLCNTFWLRFRGLMFRGTVGGDEALVFVHSRESIADTTIHMLFVFFPIGVVWLDSEKRVVDTVVARPFRPYYAPRGAAQYFVESLPQVLEQVSLGDVLTFSES